MRILSTLLALTLALAAPALALAEPVMGDDGLHKTAWQEDTFKDMAEDLESANAEGKRLLIMWEQRGCIYCTKMHEKIFPDPAIDALLNENFYVVQMNLFGDVEVTDFDGTALSEKQMARRWGVVFTPTLMFMPETQPGAVKASEAAVVTMPGAFERLTTTALLTWVLEKGYEGDEHFQKYVARMVNSQK